MMQNGNDDPTGLGIDTSPRGPLRPGPRRRPAVPSSALLGWSRAFWGLMGLAATGLAWCLVAGFLDGPAPAARERKPDPVFERFRRDREAGLERDRERAEAEEAARAGRAGRLGPKLDGLAPDRRLWLAATPEAMALEWARRARPGDYRVVSARKLYAVLVATLEDTGTGQAYGLRADLLPGADEAKLRLTEMRDP